MEERETRQGHEGGGATEKQQRLPLALTIAGLVLAAFTVFYGLALERASEAYAQEKGTEGTEGSPPSTRVKTCDGGEAELLGEEARMVELHNEAREKEGLEYLCVEPRLGEAAQGHADDMIERDYFDHNSPPMGDSPGKGMEDRLKESGYEGYEDAGENIAWGSGESAAPEDRFDGLMNSEGHRNNILNAAYREVGIGYAEETLESEGDAGVYVMDFGSMGARAPHEAPEVLPAGGTTGGTVPETTGGTVPETTGGTVPETTEDPTPIEGTIPDAEEPETTGPETTGADPGGDTGGDTGGGTMINEGTQIITEGPDNSGGDDGGDDDGGKGLSLAEKMICDTFGGVRKGWVDEMGDDFLDPGYCGFGEGKDEGGDGGDGGDGADEVPQPDEAQDPEVGDPTEETSPEETTALPEETTGGTETTDGGEEQPPTEDAGVR